MRGSLNMETNQNINQTEETLEEGTKEISREQLKSIFQRINGRNADGSSKVVVTYQTYAMDEPEDSVNRKQIYSTEKPAVEIALDTQYPNFFTVDFKFRSFEDPELKLLWGRLQRFKNNIATDPTRDWIFYIQILERASVTQQTEVEDTLLLTHILNPALSYLTREIPDMLTTETQAPNVELYGGNTIRMLIPIELVRFEIKDDVDTLDAKGEVLREEESNRYQNSAMQTDDGETW